MDCSTCREALSARLDGEAEPAPAAETDAHLAQCPACTAWQVRAQALTRAIRVRPAEQPPDLVVAALAVRPRPAALIPRLALAVVALVQFWIALAQLLTPSAHGDHGLSGHLFNEGAAWNLALGIGLLVAAVRVTRASGLLPTLTGFVALLVALSIHDLAQGTATFARVASHLPLLAGLALLYLVARLTKDKPTPQTPALVGEDDDSVGSSDIPDPVHAPKRRRGHLRPTAEAA
ncbi:putative anti-sigma-YlaC factor YlaD [Actinokineospora baliensis]|uniref:zf-HC2 domain-containing protein n=1 Tax=Actinokineospora baliensis TaxID=547056 RepID=UPI00195AF2FC|nr:zf-HC2 domain-containing protein [Actinokineospora baliensis]MBM7775532.1 putative anti-sigma-YlaC factor YlaD [Actinokineospora baliensis]